MRTLFSYYILMLLVVFGFTIDSNLNAQKKNSLPVYPNSSGKLQYTPDNSGNRVPDFSYCGYQSGNTEIPDIPVEVFVPYQKGDATELIQKAITYIATLPLQENGFRGTILLDKGTFLLEGRLVIPAPGIIIRGSGTGSEGTTLLAAGNSRETLIKVAGKSDIEFESEIPLSEKSVPVNSMIINVNNAQGYSVGDHIVIRRPVTKEWVDTLKMHEFGGETDWLGWKPGRNNIIWDRTITGISGKSIELDAPLTTAMDPAYGGGYISKYNSNGRIENIGIENLNLKSAYDESNSKDEDHCWMAVTIENAKNCWVRQVNFEHFAGSAVAIYETAKQITVEDCISIKPISEIGGQRRYTYFTSGQQVLFQRCYAEFGYHDFSVGNFAPGPNAFVQCESHLPYSFSGTIDRWASGVLFDLVNIDGNKLSLSNREQENHGAGWTAANSMIWQCTAAKIECYSPPTSTNWAYGVWGQFSGNGFWYEANSHINPRSLYYAQLGERLNLDGNMLSNRAQFLPIEFESTSSPSVELAKELTKLAYHPRVQLKDWIADAKIRNPIPVNAEGAYNITQLKSADRAILRLKNTLKIKNGWLTDNNGVLTGSTLGIQWWRGSVRPYYVSEATPHITRFVPGRSGTGLTDNLDDVADFMMKNNFRAINHHYGLWYDRRRDDHENIRRMNGDVWPPFYELPFARSGRELAWDGLSKYDLTKPNIWYWNRLKKFAEIADYKGLVLLHQNYFQHNILEAAAHYADFPWRTANNINHTGFPEPPNYAGNKRIFIAEQFYDLTNEHRREIHEKYIRQCLDNFKDNTNVIQFTGEEYTGPLHFVEFWVDVIAEWEKENNKNVFTALSTTKDVQDAILNDPVRSKSIDIIDIKYWQYREDGTLYAPKGGQNLAPRQYARLISPGRPSFNSVYKAVSDYKLKYPDKAIIYSNWLDADLNWAVFMAGGSMAAIPEIQSKGFLKAAIAMKPVPVKNKTFYQLVADNGEQIIYMETNEITVDIKKAGTFLVQWINPKTGEIIGEPGKINGSKKEKLQSPVKGDVVLWIKKV